jgi:general stress protein 26
MDKSKEQTCDRPGHGYDDPGVLMLALPVQWVQLTNSNFFLSS